MADITLFQLITFCTHFKWKINSVLSLARTHAGKHYCVTANLLKVTHLQTHCVSTFTTF